MTFLESKNEGFQGRLCSEHTPRSYRPDHEELMLTCMPFRQLLIRSCLARSFMSLTLSFLQNPPSPPTSARSSARLAHCIYTLFFLRRSYPSTTSPTSSNRPRCLAYPRLIGDRPPSFFPPIRLCCLSFSAAAPTYPPTFFSCGYRIFPLPGCFIY
jgi:hypothetical protein